jgi:shikimate dehydrogenase
LRIHYQLIDAGIDALPTLIGAARLMGFAGLNITFPCKQAVIALLDDLADQARAIGAVNTIVRDGERLIGHNTDGSGWSWGFRRVLPDADLSRVVLMGAGGAGAACADAELRLGAQELLIYDQERSRATDLARRLGGRAKAADDLAKALKDASGLIHATPTGMAAFPGMPFPEEWLRASMWVSEVVYVPLETDLLKAARRAGCAVVDGGHMNVGQAVRGFELFTGLKADPVRMDAHFRSLVG